MKKIIALLLMVIMVVSMVPLVFADGNETDDVSGNESTNDSDESDVEVEDETSDEETEEEVSAFEHPEGAEMRLLQLEESIAKTIVKAEEIIARVAGLNESTTELEDLVAQLQDLQLEVADLDPNADDAVETFVAIKKDAKNIVKQFRELVHEIIPEQDRDAIRKNAKAKAEERIANYKEKISEKRCAINAKTISKILDALGTKDEDLVASVAACETTAKEAHTQLRELFSKLDNADKKDAHRKVDATLKKSRVAKLAASERAFDHAYDKAEGRAESRLDRIKNNETREKVEARLESRLEEFKERHEVRIEDAKDRYEERTEIRKNGTRVEERIRIKNGEIKHELRVRDDDDSDEVRS
jgi:chromosome segregation ATPase